MSNKVESKETSRLISDLKNFVYTFRQEWSNFNFKNPSIQQTKILIYVIPTIVCLIELIFLHNVFFVADSFFRQLKQALNLEYYTQDPPLFSSLFNFFLIKIFDSFIGVYLFQLFLSIIAISQSCKCLILLEIKNSRIILFSFIFSIIPSTFNFQVHLGRDSMVGWSMVILIAILSQSLITKHYSLIFALEVGLFSGFISLFRVNYVVWVLGIYVALFFIKSLPKLRILLSILTMFIFIMIVDFFIQFFYAPTEVRSTVGLSVPLQVDAYILSNRIESSNYYFSQIRDSWNTFDSEDSGYLRSGSEIDDIPTFLAQSGLLCVRNLDLCLMGIWTLEQKIMLGFSQHWYSGSGFDYQGFGIFLDESNISNFYEDPLSFFDSFCLEAGINCSDSFVSSQAKYFLNLFQNIKLLNFTTTLNVGLNVYLFLLILQSPFFFIYLLFSTAFIIIKKKIIKKTKLKQNLITENFSFFHLIEKILSFLIFFAWWYILINALTIPFYDVRFFTPIMILEPLVFFLLGVYIFHYRKMKKTLSNSENNLKTN